MNWLSKFFKKAFNSESSEEISENLNNNILITQDYLIELEEKLLKLDCGSDFTEYIINKIKLFINNKSATRVTLGETLEELKNLCIEVLLQAEKSQENINIINNNKLNIIFIAGVNGSGKTTSIGKLANYLKNQNKKVLIAPCDTFRAAAQEQVSVWAKRAGVEILTPSQGSSQKADSILFEAIQKAQAEKFDILLVDTSGRLQNKENLMQELKKIYKVIEKHASDAEIHRWLVIDSSTGQNGYQQALKFNEITKLTGIILTKFDGSAKGGVIFAIAHSLRIPIKFLGIGEKIEQIEKFEAKNFINKLLI